MKQLSLENLGVQELDAREMVEVDGGNPWWQLVKQGITGGLLEEAWECIQDIGSAYWEHRISGDGYNGSVPGVGPR